MKQKLLRFGKSIPAIVPVLALWAGVLSPEPAGAQCGLSISSSAGVLSVSSSSAKLQRIRWYKDGVLVKTEEAAWNSSATTITQGTSENDLKHLLYPQVHGYKDTVYIADFNNRVLKWWPGLAAPQIIVGNANGIEGAPPSGVWAPMHAFADAANELYIGEFAGKCASKYIRSTGQLQLRVGINVFVTSVWASRDSLYITDWSNNRVMLFPPGANVFTGGQVVLPTVNQPRYVSWYRDSLYLAYENGSVIKKYARGSTTGITVAGTGTAGTGLNQLSVATGFHIDRLGNLYAAEQGNNRVTKWLPGATSGVIVAGTGVLGLTATQLKNPARVWISDDGYMYVSDNSRLQQFAPVIAQTLPATDPGVYKAVTDGFNGCRDSVSFTIPAEPDKPGNFIGFKGSVCRGDTGVVYMINRVATATGYTWSYTPSAGVTITRLSDTSVKIDFGAGAADGRLGVVAANSGGSSPAREAGVVIHNLPSVSVTPAQAQAICQGDSVALTAQVTGTVTYTWKLGSAVVGSAATCQAKTTGAYTLTVTDGTTACTATAAQTVQVTVHALPVVSVTPAAGTVCMGDSTVLSVSPSSNVTYVWSPGTALNTTSGATVKAGPSSAITYTVTATDAHNCRNTATGTVTVNALPVISVSPAHGSICIGDSLSIDVTGAQRYSWSPATGLSAAAGSTVMASPGVTTRYLVTGTDAHNCTGTKEITIDAHPVPVAAVTPSGPAQFCAGDSVILQASAGTGYTYQWQKDGVDLSAGTQVSFAATATGAYRVIISGAGGCSDTAAAAEVTVYPLPAPVIARNGQELSTGSYRTYQWQRDGRDLPGAVSRTLYADSNGSYTVIVTDSNDCSNISSAYNLNGLQAGSLQPAHAQIRVYPNPATDRVYILAPFAVQAGLFTIDGRHIRTEPAAEQVYLGDMPRGIYVLKISDAGNRVIRVVSISKQ